MIAYQSIRRAFKNVSASCSDCKARDDAKARYENSYACWSTSKYCCCTQFSRSSNHVSPSSHTSSAFHSKIILDLINTPLRAPLLQLRSLDPLKFPHASLHNAILDLIPSTSQHILPPSLDHPSSANRSNDRSEQNSPNEDQELLLSIKWFRGMICYLRYPTYQLKPE